MQVCQFFHFQRALLSHGLPKTKAKKQNVLRFCYNCSNMFAEGINSGQSLLHVGTETFQLIDDARPESL